MKKFNVGIVGYGWAAGAHINAINRGPLGQVTAVCSSRPLEPCELSIKHGCSLRTYTDFAEMLANPDIQVVSLTSYHHLHKEQVIAAAKAGKHMIVEKPLALSLEDLREVERAVRAAGVKLCVCFEVRFSAQFRAIRSLADQGMLGRIHYGEVDYYHGIGPWYTGYKWYPKASEGVSSLMLAGCHAMDALLMVLNGEVEEVFSYSTQSSNRAFDAYEFPSTTVTMLKFADGTVGKVASVLDCMQPYYFHTHFVGSEGSLLDNQFHSQRVAGLERHRWSRLAYPLVDSGDVADHPYQTQFDAFFAALAVGKDMPWTSLSDAVRSHEVIFAADRSWKESRPVKLAEIRLETGGRRLESKS